MPSKLQITVNYLPFIARHYQTHTLVLSNCYTLCNFIGRNNITTTSALIHKHNTFHQTRSVCAPVANNPFNRQHRLFFSLTSLPRSADIISDTMEDVLRPIPDEDLPTLKSIYETHSKDAPHVHSLLNTAIKWKEMRPQNDFLTFFSYKGQWRQHGTFVLLMQVSVVTLTELNMT